jgi:hypothetical protein
MGQDNCLAEYVKLRREGDMAFKSLPGGSSSKQKLGLVNCLYLLMLY